MSLLRLLSTGKSLVTVRDTESRYRLTTQRLLPKFGPTKNPFAATETAGPPVFPMPPKLETGSLSPKATARKPARLLWQRMSLLLSEWRVKISRMLALAGPPSEPTKLAIPRFCRSQVQGELSLDRVKVVRNDLRDTDLEVVPAQSKPAPTLGVGEPADGIEEAWGRVTTQGRGVGKAYAGERR